MYSNITNLIKLIAIDPSNAELNFKLAQEYEEIGQLATAISFYLKCAEYNIDSNKEIVYFSLIKIGICFEKENERSSSVINSYLQAIQLIPHKPEAYLFLSKFYEKMQNWQESYTFAEIGLMFAKDNLNKYDKYVNYLGRFSLTWQKAVTGNRLGRFEESKSLFLELANIKNLPDEYQHTLSNNLNLLNLKINKIAIILPVRDGGTGRSKRLMRCLTSWSKFTEGLSDIHIIIDEDDVDNFKDLYELKHKFNIYVKPSDLTLMQKINTIGIDIANRYKYMCFVGDDIVFSTTWESKFINHLSQIPAGLVYGNTLDLPESVDWATHPCITSNLVQAVGFYGCPAVAHNFFDNYWSEVCREIGQFSFMPDVVMDHRRTDIDKDKIYWKIVDLQEKDRVKYNEYKQNNFQEDIRKIREQIPGL